MSNVINLFGDDDLINCTYYLADGDEHVGLAMRDRSLIVTPVNLDTFEVYLNGQSQIYTRAELAEFLQVLAVLVDPEGKFLPEGELVGLNYE
ncbi:MAG: hypothetical protein V3T32_00475 [Thermodesulfobacteriota bacterium]